MCVYLCAQKRSKRDAFRDKNLKPHLNGFGRLTGVEKIAFILVWK